MIMHRNIRLYGKWMYERSDIADMVRLIENGMLKLGVAGGFEEPAVFPLEKWQEAFDEAAENVGIGKSVVIAP